MSEQENEAPPAEPVPGAGGLTDADRAVIGVRLDEIWCQGRLQNADKGIEVIAGVLKLIDRKVAALAACQSAPAAGVVGEALKWQPIETAPKDHREVLFFHPQNYRAMLGAVIRVGHLGDWPNRKPTHWMPLPAPPVTPIAE